MKKEEKSSFKKRRRISIKKPTEKSEDEFITRCLEYANQMQIKAIVVFENFIPVGAMERVLKEG